MEVKIIKELGKTGFYNIFKSQSASFWNGLFIHKDWKVVLFGQDESFLTEENKNFLDDFMSFFRAIDDVLFITPPLFDSSSLYPTLKFSSKIHLTELPYFLEEPIGSNVATNFTDDLLWGESGEWGLYHSCFYFKLALGFSPKVSHIFEKYLGNHPKEVDTKYFYNLIKDSFYDFKKIPIQEQLTYTNMLKDNNHWIPESFGNE